MHNSPFAQVAGAEPVAVPVKDQAGAGAHTVVIGLGNSLLSDDGVGQVVTARLRRRLAGCAEVRVVQSAVGGLGLMENLVGFQRALIVDAMLSGTVAPGTVLAWELREATGGCRNLLCGHGADLATAVGMGRELGLALPTAIVVVGIEVSEVTTFGSRLSPAVAAAVPVAVEKIMAIKREHDVKFPF